MSGRANLPLAKKISKILKCPLLEVRIENFEDGEIWVKIKKSVRGDDVFVIQTTPPPGDNIMELLLILDALKRAAAGRITAVIPYFGYARQDRKDEPRVPISAKLYADLLQTAGAERVVTMELHAEQIQGFFNIPVDHLYSAKVFVPHLKNLPLSDYVVVSPDTGGVKRTHAFAKRLRKGIPLVIIDARREKNKKKVFNLIGNVQNKSCIIFDDIISTGTTIIEATRFLIERGAKKVIVCATHALLTNGASEKILASPVEQVFITDTINVPPEKLNSKIKVISVAPLFAEVIKRIHKGRSVSSLFN